MLYLDLKDVDLFGNEAGEDEELELLNSYYLDNNEFDPFFDQGRRLSIVSARKGMGKSALVSRLHYRLLNEAEFGAPLVVRVKGNDLLGLGDFVGKDPVYLENYWKQIICKKIILDLGANIGFAFTSDEMSMVEMAELEGMKSRNLIGGLVARIKGKIPLVSVEVSNSFPANAISLLNNYQEANQNSVVWVLIDDIDSKFQNNADYQGRVGSFFSAIRALSHELQGINIRATVRSDVWSCLRHLEDLDKLEQYLIDINWTKRNMRDMLAKKILTYIKRRFPQSPEAKLIYTRDYNKIFDVVFDSPIIWGRDHQATLFEAIAAFSNRRPRWMGQLCKMAGIKADKMPYAKKIKLDHINYILEAFGRKRRDDLIKEHSHQFSELESLIDSFRATEREFSFSDIETVLDEKFIRGREQAEIPRLDGVKYIKSEDLGHFIYKLGLISRVYDDGRSFTHFADDPDLYRSRENKSDNIVWSIHPAYRNFLNIH